MVDCRGKFLDMSIRYPASTSDLLLFEGSTLYGKLEEGLLHPGLCLFGDNAYINTPFLATPYPNVSSGYKDGYNFFHSQLRIRVECAFGMFVQRWGILRSAIPMGISIGKTTALVLALAKLHNFCIERNDMNHLAPLISTDEFNLQSSQSGSIILDNLSGGDDAVPTELIGGGDHFDDIPRDARREAIRRHGGIDAVLPRESMAMQVAESGLRRPRIRGGTRR